ncbi:MAG TPA: 2-phospho-L-lactate guanylyltransferase [Stellaceae bacterium]|nr:2-phospho-L-lactate guanylyltransferase [Stellaceae bacterium]
MSALWAVVPVKELDLAKTRLAPVLDASARRALMLAMLEDVLAALAGARHLAGIIVATLDPVAAAVARRFGADISRADAGRGHSEAVAAVARALARKNAAMLTLAADIPLACAADIDALARRGAGRRRFVIVPSRDGTGTNAALCNPADLVPLRFGAPSFRAHLAAARARGLKPAVLRRPRLALDIDEPSDLAALRIAPGRSRAKALLPAAITGR